MATTTLVNGVRHTAGGDETTGRKKVALLMWIGSSTAGDDLAVRDSHGDLMLEVKSDGSQFIPIYYPFGKKKVVDGIETDVLDGGTVIYIWE